MTAVPAPAGVVLALYGLPFLGLGTWLRRRKVNVQNSCHPSGYQQNSPEAVACGRLGLRLLPAASTFLLQADRHGESSATVM